MDLKSLININVKSNKFVLENDDDTDIIVEGEDWKGKRVIQIYLFVTQLCN